MKPKLRLVKKEAKGPCLRIAASSSRIKYSANISLVPILKKIFFNIGTKEIFAENLV